MQFRAGPRLLFNQHSCYNRVPHSVFPMGGIQHICPLHTDAFLIGKCLYIFVQGFTLDSKGQDVGWLLSNIIFACELTPRDTAQCTLCPLALYTWPVACCKGAFACTNWVGGYLTIRFAQANLERFFAYTNIYFKSVLLHARRDGGES